MALKSDRHELQTDISFFMNEVKNRGHVVCHSGSGASGAAMDNSSALVTVAASPSGKIPVGLLLNDMVNIDQTRQHINWHKDEVQKGGKVTLLRKGWVVTDQIAGSPVAGNVAYVNNTGLMTNHLYPDSDNASGNLAVGRFLSSPDEDGYCKIEVNLPNFGSNELT